MPTPHKHIATPRPWWLVCGATLPVVDLGLLLATGRGPVLLHVAALGSLALLAARLWRHGRLCRQRVEQLEDGIESLDEGFGLFDADDRLVMLNEAYRRMYPKRSAEWHIGDRFEDMLRTAVTGGEILAAVGREDEWLRERMAMHRNPGPPWLQALEGDRWVRVHERRTPAGAEVGLRADVTELVRTQQELAAARAQAQQDRQLLERAIDAMPAGIEIYDENDRLLLANRRMFEWYPLHSYAEARGQTFEALLRRSLAGGVLPAEAIGREEEWIAERLAHRGTIDQSLIQQLPNGLWLKVDETRSPEGYLVAVRQDVSDLIAKERALQTSQAQLQAIIGTAGVAILTLDADGIIHSANPTTEIMLGYSHEELIAHDVGLLLDPPSRAVVAGFLRLQRQTPDRERLSQQREFTVMHKTGRELTVQLALAEVRSGTPLFVAVLTDITERKRFEIELRHANEQLLRLSTTDALTELANRRLLMHRLEDEWRRALRSQEPLSLLLIDVDFFKLYNDHYGHQAGDRCLLSVARVLAGSAHRPSDLAARYGGEEFVLLLPQTDAAGAMAVAQSAFDHLREAALEHALSPLGPFVTLSMGLVSGRAGTDSSAAQWLAQADLALYRAKAQGRNRIVQAA